MPKLRKRAETKKCTAGIYHLPRVIYICAVS